MWKLFVIFNYPIKQLIKWGGGKIKPNELDNGNDNKTKKIILKDNFYLLTQNIRNSQSLTNDNMELIETLDNEKLIELVKLYNVIIINLTDFIKKDLKD